MGHANFSVMPMRDLTGMPSITKVCDAFAEATEEHMRDYGEGNDKRLLGKLLTYPMNEFKYAVADRGASIRIPREAEQPAKGYLEDRRPGANCDPYLVTKRMMWTTGHALSFHDTT